MDTSLKIEFQQNLQELQNKLLENNKDGLAQALAKFIYLLPDFSLNKVLTQELNLEQTEFYKHYYVQFLNIILSSLNSYWDGILSKQEEYELLDSYFLKGMQHDAIFVLSQTISETSPSYKLTKCLDLVESFLTTDCLAALMLHQCRVRSNNCSCEVQEALWDVIISLLISFPERLANKLQHKNRMGFLPEKYFTALAANFFCALNTVHDAIKADQDCSLQFLSGLLGRVCLVGYGDELLGYLVPRFLHQMKENFIWRRLCQKLFSGIPDRCLESVVIKVVKFISRPEYMTTLLGDAILKNNKLRLLLTQKLLFVKTFENDLVLRNIIGYISDAEAKKTMLLKVFASLLDVWGDRSAIKHSSYDQHLYITKALLIIGGILKKENFDKENLGLLGKFTEGITAHLHCPQPPVRRLGMVTAKTLIPILDSTGFEIDFEFETDEEVKKLQSLVLPLELKDDFPTCELTSEKAEFTLKSLEHGTNLETGLKNANITNKPSQDHDLDSDDEDDDLTAYDMSGDTATPKVKRPLYLRDCMEGLVEQNNPDRIEACLQSAEKLIIEEQEPLSYIAVEFAKILLHLENNAAIQNFSLLKDKALVALLLVCPEQVAGYLTQEFYDRNYSIQQRLNILDVLSAAAQQLSKPDALHEIKSKVPVAPQIPSNDDWRKIIQDRLEAKTKRFGKGTQKQLPQIKNAFASVAGHFFFPLMKDYDKKENTLDLLGEDCLVLGRLLYSLGIILYSAVHAPIVRQMAKSLLDFTWSLRYHTETFVRRALLFCLNVIILTVPAQILVNDFQDDVLEFYLWARDILSADPDIECQKLASCATQSLTSLMQQGLPSAKD